MISLGENHCLMMLGNGDLYGVGSNDRGQLGPFETKEED